MQSRKSAKTRRRRTVTINRAPVLTLWAAVVAERLGFRRAESLTLGRAVAGLNAQSKGRRLGIFEPGRQSPARKRRETSVGRTLRIQLLHRTVPAQRTPEGIRATASGRPIDPDAVDRYLHRAFGDALEETREAMIELARAFPKQELEAEAYELYARFRPAIPAGRKGWGAKGRLDLEKIRRMSVA